jgi:hypothetical protein
MRYETYGPSSLHGKATVKEIYDWTLMRHITAVCVDLGRAFSLSLPAPTVPLELTQRRKSGPPSQCEALYNRVRGFLSNHPGQSVKAITQALGCKESILYDVLKRKYTNEFVSTKGFTIGGKGQVYKIELWSVKP